MKLPTSSASVFITALMVIAIIGQVSAQSRKFRKLNENIMVKEAA